MLQVKKRDKESSSSLVRRFTQRVRQSGILEKARDNMFYSRNKTKRQLKEEALYKEEMRKKYDKLRRQGKLEEIESQKSN